MSLKIEKLLIANNFVSNTAVQAPNIFYTKLYDEGTSYSLEQRGDRYHVTFPLYKSANSFTTNFETRFDAEEYLYERLKDTLL
jgi:hypothetical protein